jgi:heat shock protein HslJ
MRHGFLVCLLLAALAGGACDDAPLRPTVVRDVTWKLESIEQAGAATIAIANPDRFTIRLEADGRANVGADCNACNGRYDLNGSSISLSGLACTRAFCGTAVDTTYTTALAAVRTISVTESRMVLQGPGLTLRFRN